VPNAAWELVGVMHVFERKPRILIADNTPLSVLSLLGSEGLDWLFVPGADVWITDMVKEEAIRDPDPDRDQRTGQREILAEWFTENAQRIHVQPTIEGEEYRKAMTNWRDAGSKPASKPSRANRGDRSILSAMTVIDGLVQDGEAIVAIMDDRKVRAALSVMELDMDMMSTEAFVIWMSETFGMKGADTAWQTIKLIMGDNLPTLRPGDDEPVSTFKI
jgi:hypothetical protein